MASVPVRKLPRFRQMESSVYALEMVVGSLGLFWSGLRGHENIEMCQSILTGCSRDPALSSLSPQRSLS